VPQDEGSARESESYWRSAAATPACAETAAMHSWLKAALPLAAM